MAGSVSDIKKIAGLEKVSVKSLASSLKKGETVIVTSRRGAEPVGIGRNLRAKFATIVGTSTSEPDIDAVIRKASIAIKHGASIIHNGSSGGDVREIQKRMLDVVNVPMAVCHPIGVIAEACFKKRRFLDLRESEFIDQVKRDIEQGIEVLLLPLGVTRSLVGKLKNSGRIMPCCSKSGSIMTAWIAHNRRENPYCVHFDEILEMAREYNTTLSVVGAFRSGCIHDALDKVQYEELKTIKEYVDRAKKAAVGIKAGSGGHIPADKIGNFFKYQKKLLKIPIISFGPQVTDISLGYDHISSAMGQIIALMSGADMIFSITPAEHLGMPDEEHTRLGCIAAGIACHSADIAKGMDFDLDTSLSRARESLDWKGQARFTLDETVKEKLKTADMNKRKCSVCGNFCAYKLMTVYANKTRSPK